MTDHRHDPRAGRHRDPSEETFDGPVLVFSEGEAWRYRSAAGTADIDSRGVLMVTVPGLIGLFLRSLAEA